MLLAERDQHGLAVTQPFELVQNRLRLVRAVQGQQEPRSQVAEEWLVALTGQRLRRSGRAGADHRAELDRKSTRLNSSHVALSRMPSSA